MMADRTAPRPPGSGPAGPQAARGKNRSLTVAARKHAEYTEPRTSVSGAVLLAVLCAVLFATHGFAAQDSAAAKKKTSTSKQIAGKSSTSKKTASRRRSKSSKKSRAAYRRPVQQQPTADRYKEIQQALAAKGYFAGPVDGNWGADSVDALKRFQRDQNLTDDGKIGSLSLIALGLGPKRSAAVQPPASP
jgi:hypothetical protein